jgi:RimJ/RimL family protein N-acetyltransferase
METRPGALQETADLGILPVHMAIDGDISLRKVTPEDAADLFTMVERNPDIASATSWARNVRSVTDVLPTLQGLSNEDMDGRYVIEGVEGIVGSVWAFPGRQDGEFGIGYCLDAASRGDGIVTLAVATLIGNLESIGARHIYFQIMQTNADSIAVARRLGCYPAELVQTKEFPVTQQRWRLDI